MPQTKTFRDKAVLRQNYKTQKGFDDAVAGLKNKAFKENQKGLKGLSWRVDATEEEATLLVDVED